MHCSLELPNSESLHPHLGLMKHADFLVVCDAGVLETEFLKIRNLEDRNSIQTMVYQFVEVDRHECIPMHACVEILVSYSTALIY